MNLVGAVLAGGQSRRMGSDKALLEFDGQPLWRRQIGILERVGASPVALVRRPDQDALAPLCWRDRRADCGPMAGLEAALAQVPHGGSLAVLAVDMPALTPEWFRWLQSLGTGVVARHQGRAEPLAALYPAQALPLVTAALDAGAFRLQALVAKLEERALVRVVETPSPLLRQIHNINTLLSWPSTMARSASPPQAPDFTK